MLSVETGAGVRAVIVVVVDRVAECGLVPQLARSTRAAAREVICEPAWPFPTGPLCGSAAHPVTTLEQGKGRPMDCSEMRDECGLARANLEGSADQAGRVLRVGAFPSTHRRGEATWSGALRHERLAKRRGPVRGGP